jgi:hypothetical protein
LWLFSLLGESCDDLATTRESHLATGYSSSDDIGISSFSSPLCLPKLEQKSGESAAHQSAECDVAMYSKSSYSVAEFKYYGMSVTAKYFIHELKSS